jgi:UDP-2-acetamido-2-deoxy-ribo-hexuluronate aminotransferase
VPDRNLLAQHLKDDGIPTAVYYPKCLHEQPVYASLGYRYGDFPASEQASREVISLPMHPYLENAEIEQIASACRKAIQHIN